MNSTCLNVCVQASQQWSCLDWEQMDRQKYAITVLGQQMLHKRVAMSVMSVPYPWMDVGVVKLFRDAQ